MTDHEWIQITTQTLQKCQLYVFIFLRNHNSLNPHRTEFNQIRV